MSWPTPSARVRDLIRRGAEIALSAPPEWFDEIITASLAATAMRRVADDPELRAFTVRGTRANLIHWAAANVRNPGAPVPANTEEPIEAARNLVRRGYDETGLDAYRLGRNVAWRRWMQIAFELTDDPDDLRELLDVSARSIDEFIDATIAATTAQVREEREQLTRGLDPERREIAALLVNGAPVGRQRAERTLGYPLDQAHTAAVVWTTARHPALAELEGAAEALARHTRARSHLRVVASAGTVWVWLGGAVARDLDRLLDPGSGVHVAVGSTGPGLDGFRVSHLDAVSTQQMMTRLDTPQRVATFADVEGVLLLTADPSRADRFVARTLGPLETAAPALREAVRAYLREQCNASRAATRLFTHRNTVLRRLARAGELLPRPLGEDGVNVAMALEIMHWRGVSGTAAPGR
ncbi:PucR family transcriptional regulator [Streptomyces sp. NPDC090106]|uniref:PucR family transcriptional regulator n=1 Tax=Streptomyces sp. NPDC090106 TaxID=3365946 RepID=UPI00382D5988